MFCVFRGEVCRGVVGVVGWCVVVVWSCVGFCFVFLVVDIGCRWGVVVVFYFRVGGVVVVWDVFLWRFGGVNDGYELFIVYVDDYVVESGVDVKIFGFWVVIVCEL